ncbi:patatin-like phospholipase family protein [Aliikangiella sp. G2MR2-5]|uniref:patatin-like phospholipase family protein n=1 Tax=Aliikangiella sp. G2MR2-5 TaxID=2788943 RepID=UPI0018AA6A82|nr:patatin-like phospholipase family protein [Aliikangiella sp. G2MR2-5]
MTSSISLYAGNKALKQIQQNGIHQSMFDVMAGASGGPKWFTLYGLDCYLFGEFFANRENPIHTIGSSAGAWRMACFAQEDPVGAIKRLAHHYSHETYSSKPDVHEISDKAIQMLDKVLGTTGEEEIANSTLVQSHFIVARAKGMSQSENRLLQLTGLLKAATANALSRQRIGKHFERFIFYTKNASFARPFFSFEDMPTEFIPLSSHNIHQTLMASGAIPMVLRGITKIPGAPSGVYRDGGIVDYHLDINFNSEKLVLYPHFFPIVKPGWFDKKLKNRRANPENFDNVILITPSEEHVNSLPYRKISDRKDFESFDERTRIKYWQTVLDKSHLMAEDFQAAVDTGKGLENIIPIESIL